MATTSSVPPHLPDVPASPASDDALYGRRLPRPVREFLDTESSSGIFLLIATAVALVWVNSPWSASYTSTWATVIDVQIGAFSFHSTFGHFINEGLMALFFFMVGLEIKREFVEGDLRHWKTASLPVACALGGVIVPAVIYTILNAGHDGAHGWGIPMATDIAFAVGVVTVLAARVPPSLKLFLLTLAVVDDLIAIIVIGAFYSTGVSFGPLLVAAGLIAVIVLLRVAHVHWWPAFVIPGITVWFAVHASGASATIAGVLLAMLVPARPRVATEVLHDWELDLADDLGPADVQLLNRYTKTAVSTADRTVHALHPTVSFLIIPLFALANAGVVLSTSVLSAPGAARVALGAALGLVVGKLLGITLAGALAIRLGLSRLPRGTTWSQFTGVAALGGIGFTVSLFITNLAFDDPDLVQAGKLAILAASFVAAVVGTLILTLAPRRTPPPALPL